MKKVDTVESKENTRVILTDFSDILGLCARMSDNCIIDNYSILDIYPTLKLSKITRV